MYMLSRNVYMYMELFVFLCLCLWVYVVSRRKFCSLRMKHLLLSGMSHNKRKCAQKLSRTWAYSSFKKSNSLSLSLSLCVFLSCSSVHGKSLRYIHCNQISKTIEMKEKIVTFRKIGNFTCWFKFSSRISIFQRKEKFDKTETYEFAFFDCFLFFVYFFVLFSITTLILY